MSTIYDYKNLLLTAIFLLVFAACGAPDAYENEVDGGVEYGEDANYDNEVTVLRFRKSLA